MWRKLKNREELIDKAIQLRREGWSYREISAEIGVAPSTVKRWLDSVDDDKIKISRNVLSEIEKKIEKIETDNIRLENMINQLSRSFHLIGQKITVLDWIGAMRIKPGSPLVCTYVDEEGYCKRHNFGLKGFKTKEEDGKSMIHVRTYPGLCAVCPYYAPKQS